MVLNQATPYKLINNCNILLVFYTLFHSPPLFSSLHTYNLVGKTFILSCTQCVFFAFAKKENSFLLFIIASIVIIIVYDESLLEKILITEGGTVHPQATIENTNVLLDLMLLNY